MLISHPNQNNVENVTTNDKQQCYQTNTLKVLRSTEGLKKKSSTEQENKTLKRLE